MKERKIYICRLCGAEFTGIQKAFCNKECLNKYRRELRKHRPLVKDVCKRCGKTYDKKNEGHKYCSKECQQLAFAEKNEPLTRSRFWIFERNDFKCIYCGKSSIEDGAKLIVEHIFPRCAGGQNTFYNVATACDQCNTEKFGHIMRKELILRIWKRNKKRGVMYPYRYVDEIIKEFENAYPVTRIDLTQFFKK